MSEIGNPAKMHVFPREILSPYSNKTEEDWRGYADSKYRTALDLKPCRIAEIGVAAGLGAAAMMMAVPDAEYFGFDILPASHQHIRYANGLLSKYAATITQLDTLTVASLSIGEIDLFHVDGNHSKGNCTHDIRLARKCLAPGGVILCDDYDCITVKTAVARFTDMEVFVVDWSPRTRKRECLMRERAWPG